MQPEKVSSVDGALPTFLIVGAMRAGTTSLASMLRAHPDVYVPERKEIHFFNREWAKGTEWYRRQFAGARGESAIGEATPSYMYVTEGPERMASVLPDARLVATLRDPVDRAWSHYWRGRAWGLERLDFRQALEAEPDRLRAHDGHHFAYIDRGRYLRQLQDLCRFYPRESLHVVLFEDLVSTPAQTFWEVCRFLGVDDTFEPAKLGDRTAPFVAARSARISRIARTIRPRWLRRAIKLLNQRRGVSYPKMTAELRAETAARFAEDNAALAAWLGRDLSRWSASP